MSGMDSQQTEKQANSKLRSLLKLVRGPEGFNVFLQGNSKTPYATQQIGKVLGTHKPSGFTISMTGELPAQLRGMGLGKKIYGEIAKQSGGNLASDRMVSPAAERVYKSFAKRPESYAVAKSPLARASWPNISPITTPREEYTDTSGLMNKLLNWIGKPVTRWADKEPVYQVQLKHMAKTGTDNSMEQQSMDSQQTEKQANSKLRSLLKVVKRVSGSEGFDVFLQGNSKTPYATQQIGKVLGTHKPSGFTIHSTDELPAQLRGMGLDKKIYGEIAKQSGGNLASDRVVSPADDLVYQSFAKRPESYAVAKSPLATQNLLPRARWADLYTKEFGPITTPRPKEYTDTSGLMNKLLNWIGKPVTRWPDKTPVYQVQLKHMAKTGTDNSMEKLAMHGMGLGMGQPGPFDKNNNFSGRFPMGGFSWGGPNLAQGAMAAKANPNPVANPQPPRTTKADVAGVQQALSKIGADSNRARCTLDEMLSVITKTAASSALGQADPTKLGRQSNIKPSSVGSPQPTSYLASNSYSKLVRHSGTSTPDTGLGPSQTLKKLGQDSQLQNFQENKSMDANQILAAMTKFAKQDNDAEQRSATGESTGLSFDENKGDYMTGQEAWSNTSEYMRGGKKDKEPNPYIGDHKGKDKKSSDEGLPVGRSQSAVETPGPQGATSRGFTSKATEEFVTQPKTIVQQMAKFAMAAPAPSPSQSGTRLGPTQAHPINDMLNNPMSSLGGMAGVGGLGAAAGVGVGAGLGGLIGTAQGLRRHNVGEGLGRGLIRGGATGAGAGAGGLLGATLGLMLSKGDPSAMQYGGLAGAGLGGIGAHMLAGKAMGKPVGRPNDNDDTEDLGHDLMGMGKMSADGYEKRAFIGKAMSALGKFMPKIMQGGRAATRAGVNMTRQAAQNPNAQNMVKGLYRGAQGAAQNIVPRTSSAASAMYKKPSLMSEALGVPKAMAQMGRQAYGSMPAVARWGIPAGVGAGAGATGVGYLAETTANPFGGMDRAFGGPGGQQRQDPSFGGYWQYLKNLIGRGGGGGQLGKQGSDQGMAGYLGNSQGGDHVKQACDRLVKENGCTPYQASFFVGCIASGMENHGQIKEAVDKVHAEFGNEASLELYQGLEKVADAWSKIGQGLGWASKLFSKAKPAVQATRNFARGAANSPAASGIAKNVAHSPASNVAGHVASPLARSIESAAYPGYQAGQRLHQAGQGINRGWQATAPARNAVASGYGKLVGGPGGTGRMLGGAFTGQNMAEMNSDSDWDNIAGGLAGAAFGRFMPGMGQNFQRAGQRAFAGSMAGEIGDRAAGMTGNDTGGRLAQAGGWGGFGSAFAPKWAGMQPGGKIASKIGGIADDLAVKPWGGSGKYGGMGGFSPWAMKENLMGPGSNLARKIGTIAGPGALAGGAAMWTGLPQKAMGRFAESSGLNDYMANHVTQRLENAIGMPVDEIRQMAQSAKGQQQLMSQFGDMPDQILGMFMSPEQLSGMNPMMKWMLLLGGGMAIGGGLGGMTGGGQGGMMGGLGGGLGALALPIIMSMMQRGGGGGGGQPDPSQASRDQEGRLIGDSSIPPPGANTARNELAVQTARNRGEGGDVKGDGVISSEAEFNAIPEDQRQGLTWEDIQAHNQRKQAQQQSRQFMA